MGLSFTVEVFDGSTRRRLGDFARLRPAIAAARRALDSPRASMAVVLEDGITLRYAVDRRREWAESHEDAVSGVFRDLHERDSGEAMPMA